MLLKDDEYRAGMEAYKESTNKREAIGDYNKMKSSVFRRLQKSSSEYRRAREKRDEALYESNIETFEYIIDDYEKNNWVISTDWMTHHH